MSSHKYILISGFGWSGSSALVDLMREYDGNYVPKREFRLIKDPHGIRDLDMQLNNSIDALNEDIAFKEFLRFLNRYSRPSNPFVSVGLGYQRDFGDDFERKGIEYINSLCDYKYKGYWWYLDFDVSYLKLNLLRLLRRLKIYDYRAHIKLRLTIKSESEFLILTRKYLDNIFSRTLNEEKKDTVVLDQAIPANRPEWGERYFENSRVIIIDRDPRDVYIDLINEKSLVGFDIALNHDVRLFIDWFKKVRSEQGNQELENVLKIRFEDLVVDYEKTIERINSFCDLDSSLHTHKKEKFNPDISIKNIGMWKNYQYQNEIEAIASELSDYII